MHQIISGETHKDKTIVLKKSLYNNFYNEEKKAYKDLKDKFMLYQHGNIVKNIENYLNHISKNYAHKELKKILLYEYEKCEKLYPYLGSIFLYFLFENKDLDNLKDFKIDKSKINYLLKNEEEDSIKNILKIFIKNCSTKYSVSIEENNTEEIILEKNNIMVFKNEFDLSFYKRNITLNDYKLYILDGYIQNVSEIHHLLHESSINKSIDYVIFCKGMSFEVSNTIKINNARKNTRIFPISLKINEYNINILNDISIVLNQEIISADKGQTLSQSIKNKGVVGHLIKVNIKDKSFSILPSADELTIRQHIDFLNKRITGNNINDQFLIERIKNMSSKNFKIFLPKDLIYNYNFIKKINYYFVLMSNMDKNFNIIKNKIEVKNYFVPKIYLDIAFKKAISFKNILNNIEHQVIKCPE